MLFTVMKRNSDPPFPLPVRTKKYFKYTLDPSVPILDHNNH